MNSFKNFLNGLRYIAKGGSYFLGHKSLWKYALIPAFISVVIFVITIFILFSYLGDITEYIKSFLGLGIKVYETSKWYLSLIVLLQKLAIILIKIILSILGILIVGILSFVINQIISSPFYDLLSEAVEREYTNREAIQTSVWVSLKGIPKILSVELKKLAFLILIPLLLLVLNLIPAFGSMLYVFFSALFSSVVYAATFTDYPLARRNEHFRKRLIFVKNNFSLHLGFGLPILIPLVNILISPLMVTGGTLLYLESENKKAET